jgi:predicted nuclease of predicted toxin-antitoxin system
MKLLFDQNISFKIVRLIEELFPESKQVIHLGLHDQSDLDIFEFARKNDFTIVTFDADFVDISIVRGTPPKIIWLRTGNLTTPAIATLLNAHHVTILNFIQTEPDAILEILKY